jgi:hypothetical protein
VGGCRCAFLRVGGNGAWRLQERCHRVFALSCAVALAARRPCQLFFSFSFARVDFNATFVFFFSRQWVRAEVALGGHHRAVLSAAPRSFFPPFVVALLPHFLTPPAHTSLLTCLFSLEPPLLLTPTPPFPPLTRPAHALHARFLLRVIQCRAGVARLQGDLGSCLSGTEKEISAM